MSVELSSKDLPNNRSLDISHATTINSPKSSKRGSPSPCKCLHIEDQHHFHNLSASLLRQNSPARIRFNQAERFPPIKDVGPKIHTHGGSPCKKGCCDHDALDHLISDRFNLKSDFGQGNKKGPSFGLPYSVYKKIHIPGERPVPLHEVKQVPGPGAYHVEKDRTSHMPQITLKPRLKMFNEGLGVGLPPCSQYSPKTTLVMPTRHASPTFGFGKKYDFTKVKEITPGPGAYSPTNLAGKYRKTDVADKII